MQIISIFEDPVNGPAQMTRCYCALMYGCSDGGNDDSGRMQYDEVNAPASDVSSDSCNAGDETVWQHYQDYPAGVVCPT